MNYNHLHKIHSYWNKEIFPHFSHHYTAISFDDYLRRFAYLPSGKWLKNMDKIKICRIPIAVDSKKFVKKYKEFCVTYNAPVKVEDGLQRVIYQLSPTLHFEAAFWVWIEHEEIQSYVTVFVCYHDVVEYLNLMDELWKLKLEGNTEEKPLPPGFGITQVVDLKDNTKKK